MRAGAMALARAVLGAGLLLMPPIAWGMAGPAAVAAWAAHLAVGAAFSVAIGLLALRAHEAEPIAQVNGRALGLWAERLTHGCYLVGFTIGQAAIATAAARILSVGLTGRLSTPLACWAAAALVAAATVGAVLGVRLSERARNVRLAATAATALAACAWPALLRSSGVAAGSVGLTAASLVFILFFAGVGWEAMARISPSLAGRRSVVKAALMGTAMVAAAYLSLTALLAARSAAAPAPRALALVTAAAAYGALALYCLTNIPAAAAFAAALLGGRNPRTAALVGTAAGALAVAAIQTGASLPVLLLAPCSAAWIAYLLASIGAIRAGAVGRLAGGILVSLLLAIPVAAIA